MQKQKNMQKPFSIAPGYPAMINKIICTERLWYNTIAAIQTRTIICKYEH